jgi:hypothetical protein
MLTFSKSLLSNIDDCELRVRFRSVNFLGYIQILYTDIERSASTYLSENCDIVYLLFWINVCAICKYVYITLLIQDVDV